MIFLSYSAVHAAKAGEVKAELEALFYDCFLAHEHIEGRADWHNEIWRVLQTCDAFVALVTKEFNESPYCQQEVGAAAAWKKPQLFVRIDRTAPAGFSGRFQAVPLLLPRPRYI